MLLLWFSIANYKNLFLSKKSNLPRAALDLASVEKGQEIPDNTAPEGYLPFLSRTTIGTLSWNLWTNYKVTKTWACRFCHSLLE